MISQIYIWNKILHVSGSSCVHHQEFFHCTHSNDICMTYTIAVCTVKHVTNCVVLLTVYCVVIY